MTTVTVAGRINAGEFWKARRAALHAGVKRVEAMPLEPLDYELFLERKRKELGGRAWEHTAGVFCFGGGGVGYIGGADAMCAWAQQRAGYADAEPEGADAQRARDAYDAHVRAAGEQLAELALWHGGVCLGSLVFALAARCAPKTCARFCSLLQQGEAAESSALYGAQWQRLLPGAFAQGCAMEPARAAAWEQRRHASPAEVARAKAGGAGAAFEAEAPELTAEPAPLADESFALRHDRAGVLGFANRGPHSVGSQLYVTFGPMPSLDGRYVAFGRLVDGLGTLRALEATPTANEVPVKPIRVSAARLVGP